MPKVFSLQVKPRLCAWSRKLKNRPCSCLETRYKKVAWLLSALASLLSLVAFPGLGLLISPVYPVVCYAFYRALTCFLLTRQEKQEEQELAVFLTYLATRVGSGYNLELSLLRAPHDLQGDLRREGRLGKAIRKLSLSIYSGLDPGEALRSFAQPFQQTSIQIFCKIMPALLDLGGRHDIYLQLARDNLQKEIEVRNKLEAQQSSATLEVLIMSLMPFILSFLLNHSTYTQTFRQHAIYPYSQLLLLTLSCCGLCLSLKLLAEGYMKERFPQFKFLDSVTNRLTQAPRLSRSVQRIADKIQGLYGARLTGQLQKQLAYVKPDTQNSWQAFIGTKCFLFLTPYVLLLGMVAPWPLWLLPPLLACLPEAKLQDAYRRIKQQELSAYPPFLNLLAILLESGLSLTRALGLTLQAFLSPQQIQQTKYETLLERDLQDVRRHVESGWTAERSLEELAQSRFHAEIAQCLYLIVRYARGGAEEEIQMIRMQAQQSTNSYHNAMTERLSRKSLKLLLPLSFELILVLTIAALPALIELRL